jgi:hypothetical protein
MSDLFVLNELEIENKQSLQNYTNDNNYLSTVAIFIKALNRAIEKIDESEIILSKIKNINGTILDRDEEDSQLLVDFVKSIDLAGKILDEFQKGTSILNDNNEELAKLFSDLNQSFSLARSKLNLFAITKNLKYGNETKKVIENTLAIFHEMKKVITETESK